MYCLRKSFPPNLTQSTVKMLISKTQQFVEIALFILNMKTYHVCNCL